MDIITIANQKGGSGKTATALALIHAAAHHGKKVLAIDLDPQGNLTYSLGLRTTNAGSYELITGTPLKETVTDLGNNIHLIPASWNLATVSTSTGSARRLSNALHEAKLPYDIIFIDTPPTAGELQFNALQASTGLIIPVMADMYGLQGFYQMADTAEQFKATSNNKLQLLGIIFTRHNPRSSFTKYMQEQITAQAKDMEIPVLGAVREGVAIREAAAMQANLFDYAPKSNPANDYNAIYKKLFEGEF